MAPRRDNDDDIIEIHFDDEDDHQRTPADDAQDEDIEIVLHDEPAPEPVPPLPAAPPPEVASPAQPPRPRPSVPPPPHAPDDEPHPPQKYCSVCGFALRPLDATCPRCERLGTAPSSHTTPTQAETGPGPRPATTAYPPTPPARSQSRVGLIIVALVIIAIAVAIPFILLNSPGYKARTAYREAIQAQLAGDMETARSKYIEALEYDPDMGLAAFGLGTTYLGISVAGGAEQRMTMLLDSAIAGVTTELDQADHWFDHAIVLANKMPPGKALIDENISTPRKLASYAHAMKAMTAFIRYYAAILAEDFDTAARWMAVAGEQVRQSLAFDPTNPSAQEIGGRMPR